MGDLVEVVAGIAVRDGRILLQQRPASKDFPFTWECPGGKTDESANESHHITLRREWKEELGVEVGDIAGSPLWCGEFRNIVTRPDRGHVFLLFYVVYDFTGELTPREGQGFGWFTEREMRSIHLAPANQRAIDVIAQHAFSALEKRDV